MKPINVLFAILLALLPLSSMGAANKKSMGDVNPTDQFRIDFVNTPTGKILIGGHTLSEGQNFFAKESITWESKNYWIEVTNRRNGNRYKISGHTYSEVGESSLNNYIRKKYTADKGTADFIKAKEATGKFLGRYVWDIINNELYIPISLVLNDNCAIMLTSIPDNISIIADYDDETNEFIITSDMLKSKGIDATKIAQYVFHVDYIHNGIKEPLTDQFRMRYIP